MCVLIRPFLKLLKNCVKWIWEFETHFYNFSGICPAVKCSVILNHKEYAKNYFCLRYLNEI